MVNRPVVFVVSSRWEVVSELAVIVSPHEVHIPVPLLSLASETMQSRYVSLDVVSTQ